MTSKKFDKIRRRNEKENGGAQLDMGVSFGEDEGWRRRNKERKWRSLKVGVEDELKIEMMLK